MTRCKPRNRRDPVPLAQSLFSFRVESLHSGCACADSGDYQRKLARRHSPSDVSRTWSCVESELLFGHDRYQSQHRSITSRYTGPRSKIYDNLALRWTAAQLTSRLRILISRHLLRPMKQRTDLPPRRYPSTRPGVTSMPEAGTKRFGFSHTQIPRLRI